jgi:Helix-turn-helix domain
MTERITGPRRRAKSQSGIWRDAIRDSSLDRTSKAVAWCLSTYMDRHGHARPSRATIATGCSLSDRAVDRALKALSDAGYLAIARTKGGNNRVNAYAAVMPLTANPVRRAEWLNGERDDVNGERRAPSSERHSHESFESDEGSGGRLTGAAPLDDCMRCSERRPLDSYRGRLVCRECVLEETNDLEAKLREHISTLKAAA